MDIYEALEKLDSMLDYLIDMAGSGCTLEDIDLIGECEDVIYQFARKHEPKKELPLGFTCNCGEHLTRHDVHAGMCRFFCPTCAAARLGGPQGG